MGYSNHFSSDFFFSFLFLPLFFAAEPRYLFFLHIYLYIYILCTSQVFLLAFSEFNAAISLLEF